MTAVEWLVQQLRNGKEFNDNLIKQAKEMEVKQRGYSEEQVREMLFMALNEPQEKCCTTHTKDSIVRKVLKTFNQLRLAEQLENEIDNL